MKRFIHKSIQSLPFIPWFIKGPLHPWIVLLSDIILIFLASAVTFYFNPDTTPGDVGILFHSWTKATVFTFIAFAFMLIIKPYKSIVRLSAFEDTYRIFNTILVSSITALLCDLVSRPSIHYHYFGTWNVVVISFLSFTLMVSTRIIIKYVYTVATATDRNKTRVVILGSAINSYALATALKNETEGKFDPVLLLSTSPNKLENIAGNIPIRSYDPDTVLSLFEKYESDTLIFLSTQIEFIRQEAADVFLKNGIKLLMLNQIEEFNVDEDDNNAPMLSPHVTDIKIEDLLGRAPIVTETAHIKQRLHGQTVMITGAAGSIGSEIVRQVASFGAGKIILVDQAETPMHEMQLEMQRTYPDMEVRYFIADVVNYKRMDSLFTKYKPNIVYHAAAYKHVPMMESNPSEAANTNIIGTKNMADLSLKHKTQKFVMISTDKAVNPTNIMGATKRVAEIYVQSLANNLRDNVGIPSTRFITTRFGNVLGSNGSVIPLFRKQIENGGPVTVTHREIIRYFMTIPEACSLVLEAGCMGQGGEIFIFDMGKPVKIYDLATRMISLAGLRPDVDIKIVETGLRPGEKLYEELLNTRELTLPTHHKKIMIAKVRQYDYAEVCQHIDNLISAIDMHDMHEIVAELKRIVPEYKSMNSKWNVIDKEVTPDERIEEIVINKD